MVLWDQMFLEIAGAGPVFQCFLLTRAGTIGGEITQLGQGMGKSGSSIQLMIFLIVKRTSGLFSPEDPKIA